MKKYARELVESSCRALTESRKTFKDIFGIMFSRPSEIMAEWLDEDNNRCVMTFEEGEKRIRNAAYAIYENAGARGSFLALDMENSPDWIIAFWAILMSGNKPYLVNRRHPVRLTRGIIQTLGISFSVAEGQTGYPCMYISAEELHISGHEDFGKDEKTASLFANEIALSTSATTMNEVVCIYDGERVANQILNCKGILLENKA